MSIQFAGSKSQDDRRRRRLVVQSDDPGTDGTCVGDSASGGKVASELVKSAAAAPWVPVDEWRLWTYAALIGLIVTGGAVALSMPTAFRPELAPLTRHLLLGDRPVLAVVIQTTFCFLCAQLALLIGWYRAQCKLDFRGYYRVWPWAAVTMGLAAVCSATNLHGLVGQIVEQSGLLSWRGHTVAWLLPASVAALPLALLVDRDVRRGRSSLYTLRVAWVLGLIGAGLELFSPELQVLEWAGRARVILPLIAMATLFVGLWLHARVVAYICPDPPEAAQTTARSQLLGLGRWIASRLTWLPRLVWRRRPAQEDAEVETKSRRGRRKAVVNDEESAPKRKRKAPARRTSKPRARVKPVEIDEEVEEEDPEYSYSDESAESDSELEAPSQDSSEWDEEELERATAPFPPSRPSRESAWLAQKSPSRTESPGGGPEQSAEESEDEDSDAEEAQFRRDTGMTADQLKGLSKRQKRELRRQARDQERSQRR